MSDTTKLQERVARLEARETAREAVQAAGGPREWVGLVADAVAGGKDAETAVQELQEAHQPEGPPRDVKLSELSEGERMDFIETHGIDAFQEKVRREYR